MPLKKYLYSHIVSKSYSNVNKVKNYILAIYHTFIFDSFLINHDFT